MIRASLSRNLDSIRERIRAAALRAGRDPAEITLVVVTKSVSIDVFPVLRELGIQDIGENRVHALVERRAAFPASFRWHLIGSLQRNKVGDALPAADLIHSMDSLRLAEKIQEVAIRQDRTVDVLLEVNASGESTKHGLAPGELPACVDRVLSLDRLRLAGLMTMASVAEDPEETRPTFRRLAELHRAEGRRVGKGRLGPHLSMGMSQDFEVAIEEGATLVRIGTACFEPGE
ncbi:MAG: YggS family pyridoxal phosphate-dependent enzyme [Planctomycetes bacterium]|nr:YggS family pyridoxal phosphate-dependent enzyme [Planctomycetota bacterium]